MTDFSIDAAADDDAAGCVLVVRGEVDVYTADQLALAGMDSLANAALRTLTVDLSAVSFIDSTGIGALIQVRNAAVEGGKQLVVRQPSPRVRRILSLAGLSAVFGIDEDGS